MQEPGDRWTVFGAPSERLPKKINSQCIECKAAEKIAPQQQHGVAIARRDQISPGSESDTKMVPNRGYVPNMAGDREFRLIHPDPGLVKALALLELKFAHLVERHIVMVKG